MKIAKDCAVTIHFTLSSTEGDVLQTSLGEEPLVYIHGHDDLLPGLESRLEGLEAGARLEFPLKADEAFGPHDPDAVLEVPLSSLPMGADLEPGDRVEIETQGAAEEERDSFMMTVVGIEGESVTLDGNHPLAGEDLNVSVEVLEVRAATGEELAHGHAHGQCGCEEEEQEP